MHRSRFSSTISLTITFTFTLTLTLLMMLLGGADARYLTLTKADKSKHISNDYDHKMLMGGDVDDHGCRVSAGYSWCNYTNRCEFATYECTHAATRPTAPTNLPRQFTRRLQQINHNIL